MNNGGLSPNWQRLQTMMLAALLFMQTFVYQAADTVKGVRDRLRDAPTTEDVRGAVKDTVQSEVNEITAPVAAAAGQAADAARETIQDRAERLQAQLERLQAHLNTIEGVPGPEGPPGQDGSPGRDAPPPPEESPPPPPRGTTTTTRPRPTTTTTRSATTTTTRCLASVPGVAKLGCGRGR